MATPLAGAAGREPAWSPDGSRIAFDAPAGLSTVNLGIISATGGTPTPLTSGAQLTFSSWSPSGAQVGYLVSGGGEDTHWRVANADGSGDHPLTEVQQLTPGSKLSWSPDGHRVVYGGFDFGGGADTNQVYMENTDGSGSVTTIDRRSGIRTVSRLATEPGRRAAGVHPGGRLDRTAAADAETEDGLDHQTDPLDARAEPDGDPPLRRLRWAGLQRRRKGHLQGRERGRNSAPPGCGRHQRQAETEEATPGRRRQPAEDHDPRRSVAADQDETDRGGCPSPDPARRTDGRRHAHHRQSRSADRRGPP